MDENQCRGGIYGLLLGDAVGVPYEFKPPESLRAYSAGIDLNPPPGLALAHRVPPGTWSDDGSLALCLLDSLVEAGAFDPADQARRMVAWFHEGYMAVDGDVFDIGGTTRQALDNAHSLLGEGRSPLEAGLSHESSAGNGSLMRILPLALWHRGDDRDLVQMAMDQSRLTHAHPVCQLCCAIYCLWAGRIAEGRPDAFASALEMVRILVGGRPEYAAAFQTIDHWADRPPTGRGYVVDTLYSAKYALEGASDFKEVVRRSILLGHDTDTTAAVAGGLAGVRDGFEALPRDWITALRGRELVAPLLAKLTMRFR